MKKLKLQVTATIVLGFLTILAGIAGCLALTDIYHGEADLTLEWRVLQVAAGTILTFVISAQVTLGRVLKVVRG